jgi:hypothetical protein
MALYDQTSTGTETVNGRSKIGMETQTAEPEIVEQSLITDGGTGVEIEDTESSEPITSPFDPSLINVAPRPMTIDLLISRMKEGEIDLSPDFQRRQGIWNDGAQSRLIESLLIRIPLPAQMVWSVFLAGTCV